MAMAAAAWNSTRKSRSETASMLFLSHAVKSQLPCHELTVDRVGDARQRPRP